MATHATKPEHDDWDRHWAEHAPMNALNPAQTHRRELIFEFLELEKASSPVRVLDLGCGPGEVSMHVAKLRPDAEVAGFDLSAEGLAIAQRKLPRGKFRQRDFTQPMPAGDEFAGWATHAVCTEVLEHIDDPTTALRNMRGYFAPGGRLVITVPAGPMSAFDKYIGHRRHFTAEGLRAAIEGAGFEVAEVRGAGFPFFNLYRLAVVARGKKLIDDVIHQDETKLPLTAKATIRAFGLLFKMNTAKTTLGWQLIAVARAPR